MKTEMMTIIALAVDAENVAWLAATGYLAMALVREATVLPSLIRL